MASQAKDHDVKAAFIECALQWQELAGEKRKLEQDSQPNSN
jgi:hypothetical protein